MFGRRNPRHIRCPVLAIAVSRDDRLGRCIAPSVYLCFQVSGTLEASQWHEMGQFVKLATLGIANFKVAPAREHATGWLRPNPPRQEAAGATAAFLLLRLGVASQLGVRHAQIIRLVRLLRRIGLDCTAFIAAAAADRTSFGCSSDRDLTNFGEAFLRDALPRFGSMRDAFETARASIAAREKTENLTPSMVGSSTANRSFSRGAHFTPRSGSARRPTAYFGTAMENRLGELEGSLPHAQPTSAP